MPHYNNTPESILPRSDSRNPASTCSGITVSGKPCRRSLAASTRSAPSERVAAIFKGEAGQPLDAAAFYCWQHKDQAPRDVYDVRQRYQADIVPPAKRTSIDTLVERLGILNVDTSERVQRPQAPTKRQNKNYHEPKRPPARKSGSFCCFRVMDAPESLPPSRPVSSSRYNGQQGKQPTAPRPSMNQQRPVFIRNPNLGGSHIIQHRPLPLTPERWPNTSSPPSSRHSASPYETPTKLGYLSTPPRFLSPSTSTSSSQTKPLLSLIPPHLSPQSTALLLTELAKPISDADEDGYIYIFWVTPQSTSAAESLPPREIASNLLPSPHVRRTSDALRAAKGVDPRSKGSGNGPGTIRLKIGRTTNVHRRLNEWSKQCSHDLTLVRYYPYTASSPSPSPARTPSSSASREHGRRVPHVHRVERLIHIELADQRVKGQGPCPECGKGHREWFEFEATKEALRLVDECVRRWVSWGEQHE
ncbi:hypothetical protein PISL3812_04249 [Talaromyces islandicus]|uniref:Bacteriophage T5 Orf172 DNA-binding domain-containing protein n=1 Tax=Talaromyces islandicus TaxID=28573 RepID=A0A0U1LVV9_TALIS|nr:hypothetical protein PISL3812_04249 [Talaromyces islandicus]